MAFNLSTLLLCCLSSKVMKKSSMKPGGTESVWCQLGKTSVILVHWFMLIQSPNPKLPNLYVFIGTNPKQPSNSNPTPTTPTPTSTMGCQAIAWFWRNLWVPVPSSLQTCVPKLVGLGSKQPWNPWPAPMVSGHEGNQWFFLSLKKALFLGKKGVALGGVPPKFSWYKDDLLGHYDMVAHVFVLKVVWGFLWTFTC